MTRHAKPIVLAVMIVAMLSAVALLPVTEWLAIGVAWIESHRTIAWIAYVTAYIVATVFVIPASIFTLAGGFVFGLPLGIMLASVGSVLGASVAFLVGRFLARDWVAKRIASLPQFRALDMATRHEGFVIVFLARLSPLFPFNLINYGLALTSVRFRDYFFGSWAGMLPVTILYVYISSVAKDLTELTSGEVQGGAVGQILLFIGLAATILLTIIITRKANRTLAEHLEREPVGQEDAS
ncbi:MAG TPA: TVP38/TMEM64 family protein [Gammaproteobacteria bacterium]|nr:TVP38/TMEM64 family protein [Gammaproteobacteria bacterium]